jgi:type I restriction enzyme S subunit
MSFPRYPAYKDSGVEWLGEVPEHWEELRLRFAAMLNPSKQESRLIGEKETVSFLPMEAIGEDGSLSLEQEKEVGEFLNGYTYFKEGDVCIAKITPCFENGKGAILRDLKGGIGFGTTELIVARPRTEIMTAQFLDYLFRSSTFRSLGEAAMYGAGGQKRVPDSFVRDFASFLPPIAEQSAIATFLDRETAKIDALIAEQQRLIELLQEKRQAVISHTVTKGLNPDAPMKDSGVEWLGEVPEHWGVTRLKHANCRLSTRDARLR